MHNKIAYRYLRRSILVVAALFLATLLGINIYGTEAMIMPSVICTVFQLVACIAYAALWKHIANHSTANLPTLYLVASGSRMFAAVVTVMCYCFLQDDKTLIKFFAIVFLIYYFVLLIYDTIFFVDIEKKLKKE